MRGAIGRRFPSHCGFNLTSATHRSSFVIQPSSDFSSSSGSGRGRGRGGGPTQFDFIRPPGQSSESDDPRSGAARSPPPPPGLGHGRGRPIDSESALPGFTSFISSIRSEAFSGVGRGRGGPGSVPPGQPQPQQHGEEAPSPPKSPIFVKLQEIKETAPESPISETIMPSSMLQGAGRGKPGREDPGRERQTQEENRHIRRGQQQQPPPQPRTSRAADSPAQPKLSREEAVKKAVSILSRGDGAEGGFAGGRGRGRGRGRGVGRGGGRGSGRGDRQEREVAEFDALYVGDDKDGEKFAQKVGHEVMNKLMEGYEEMSERILPSPLEDAYLDAFDTNLKIECEPEYMVEFENPDIDEKPPIPLRDALEKMKPFLMAYEGIKSHEEWEEVIDEVMERVPLLKEIVDHYSGPDRVTAKQQKEELERVAKTIPQSAPDSVKRFADRAVLSLQSNPGWGFDKKCQFMDKLVREVSQNYK